METSFGLDGAGDVAFEIFGWEDMDSTERLEALQGIADEMVGNSGEYSVRFGVETNGTEGDVAFDRHIDFEEGTLGAMSADEAVDRLMDKIGGFDRQIDETVAQYGSADSTDGMEEDADSSLSVRADEDSRAQGKCAGNVSFGCVGICGARCLQKKEPVRGWWIDLNDGVP